MVNFIWIDIDSSLQTNDSKWLDSSCVSTQKKFGWLWSEELVTLTQQMWLGHITAIDLVKILKTLDYRRTWLFSS